MIDVNADRHEAESDTDSCVGNASQQPRCGPKIDTTDTFVQSILLRFEVTRDDNSFWR
jgi:hypothetical protein